MKTTLAASLSLALFFTATPLAQRRDLVTVKNKRVALVIGNAAYKGSPLLNPVNDAKDMAQLLGELGFGVIYKQNASQAEMKSAIREFGNNIVKGDVALFYFAGHGAQVNGVNYLIPVDAVITKEEEIEYESVNAGLVLAQMASAANKLNIVILDACRNNPFARSFRSQTHGLAQMTAPAGTIVAYATDPGSVAADGKGKNGFYTEELLKAMRLPGLKIEDVFKQVRVAVRNKSQGKQTPWESSSLEGDFYFTQPGDNKDKVVERVETTDGSLVELKFWESIEKSKDPKDFEAYLKKYPNGNFVGLANNRVKSLEAAKGGAPPNPAGDAPNLSPPNSSSRNEQPQMLVFKLKHDLQFGDDHDGTLSISSQQIQWEESGLFSDQKDNFSLSCSNISSVFVALRKGFTKAEPNLADLSTPDLANREYITIYLTDKKLNQKGRTTYSFLAPTESDRQTINEVGEVIQRTCPGIKIKAYRR
ncbi:MAG: caspase family protein [Acidobacteria bacterium]|nr:caspase family protein [Acidobacteriota bacterium]